MLSVSFMTIRSIFFSHAAFACPPSVHSFSQAPVASAPITIILFSNKVGHTLYSSRLQIVAFGQRRGVQQVEEVLEDDIPSRLFGKPFNRLCPHISIRGWWRGCRGTSRRVSAKRERTLSLKDLVKCKHQDVPENVHIAVPSLPAVKHYHRSVGVALRFDCFCSGESYESACVILYIPNLYRLVSYDE